MLNTHFRWWSMTIYHQAHTSFHLACGGFCLGFFLAVFPLPLALVSSHKTSFASTLWWQVKLRVGWQDSRHGIHVGTCIPHVYMSNAPHPVLVAWCLVAVLHTNNQHVFKANIVIGNKIPYFCTFSTNWTTYPLAVQDSSSISKPQTIGVYAASG